LIDCVSITKSYADQVVLKNFSFSFPDHGFILLYGESGCGKTTLLNVLAGLIPFDNGKIILNNNVYTHQVDREQAGSLIGYITQDSYFVDYLNVFDNLRLSSTSDEDIIYFLSVFGLDGQKDNFPKQLSGGERQRLAIIRALLDQKEILLLDEPTASLDAQNKQSVFNALSLLKDTKLIICSSHDPVAKDFAEQIIDFHNPDNYKEEWPMHKPVSQPSLITENKPEHRKKRKLFPFINKWYTYSGKEKKSKVQLAVVFLLAFLTLCLGDIPSHKLDSNTEYVYKLNQLRVACNDIEQQMLTELQNNKSVYEVNVIYNRSAPDGIDPNGDSVVSIVDYNLTAETLPYNSEAFRLSDRIAYGTYFTGVNQIILSSAMAKKLGDPESLIGQTYQVAMYDGTYDMEIVGIFPEFTETEKEYLRASGIAVYGPGEGDDVFFINGKLTERYIQDPSFFMRGNRAYVIYFRSYRDMRAYYNKVREKNLYSDGIQYIYADINTRILNLFYTFFYVLLPISILVILVSLLFYYQTQRIEMVYNRQIFSVFNYTGYSIPEIKKCLLKGNIWELLKILAVSFAVSLPLMIIINMVNLKILIVPFQIFTFNIPLLALFASLVVFISVVTSLKTIKKIKILGWYQILLEQRDLL
jgi:ABC-type lipoprotein export system ATPase subunit